MGEISKFPGYPDRRDQKPVTKEMEDGGFYDLHPPSVIGGQTYDRVQYEYQVPNNPDEYVVRGIPRGETGVQSFVLRFSRDRGVQVVESTEQEFET